MCPPSVACFTQQKHASDYHPAGPVNAVFSSPQPRGIGDSLRIPLAARPPTDPARTRALGCGTRAAGGIRPVTAAVSGLRSSRRMPASEDRQTSLPGQDLAPGAPFGCVGPGLGMLAELEKRGEHAGHVGPVVRIVGLDDEQAARRAARRARRPEAAASARAGEPCAGRGRAGDDRGESPRCWTARRTVSGTSARP